MAKSKKQQIENKVREAVGKIESEVTNWDGVVLTKDDVVGQIMEFPTKAAKLKPLETDRYITVAAVVSPSLDRENWVLPGRLTAAEVVAEVFCLNPEWWGTPDQVEITDLDVFELKAPVASSAVLIPSD